MNDTGRKEKVGGRGGPDRVRVTRRPAVKTVIKVG